MTSWKFAYNHVKSIGFTSLFSLGFLGQVASAFSLTDWDNGSDFFTELPGTTVDTSRTFGEGGSCFIGGVGGGPSGFSAAGVGTVDLVGRVMTAYGLPELSLIHI